jgi:hypothetical protein
LCEFFVSDVNEKLWNFVVGHDFFNCENWTDVALDKDFQEILNVGVFWHLEHDVFAEFKSVVENVGQFWVH